MVPQDAMLVRIARVDISTGLDERFEEHTQEFHGIVARIVQHEYDHTQGLVFTDRTSSLRKQMLQSRLKGMAQGKVKAKYPIKIRN